MSQGQKNPVIPKNPVVLVHGLNDTARVFDRMTENLAQLGWPVHSLNLLPANGDCCLKELAQQLADFIHKTLPAEQPFDLLGFSMGGMVSRYYLQRLGGIDRVQRFISISAPNFGTVIAFGSFQYGCMQMRPNHDFINDLNRDLLMLRKLNFTAIWTPMDLMIVPASNSQMPFGKDVKIPVPLHPWMLTDARSIGAVVEALQEPVQHP
jgi:triacylglycerol lipase